MTERRARTIMVIQRRFGVAWLLTMAAVILLSSGALFLLLRGVLSKEIGTQFSHAFFVMEQARNALWVAVGFSLIAYVVLVSILVAVVTARLTSHIAWPLYQLERFAEAFGRGDLFFFFHLRRRDQLQELTQAFDEVRDRAASDMSVVHSAVERIERRWADLGTASTADYERDTEKLLEFLASDVETIRARLRPGSCEKTLG